MSFIMRKRAISMPFNWIFAIIAGAIIILIATYGSVRFMQTGEEYQSSKGSVQFSGFINFLQTGVSSGISIPINLNENIKMRFECNDKENLPFGKESISFIIKEQGEPIEINDKYVFSETELQGDKFILFSKPFLMPYKIGDLIVVYSGDYCFYNPPIDVREEIIGLNLNINMTADIKACKGKVVCFDNERRECDVKVYTAERKIIRKNKEVHYSGNLIFAAIFSDKEIYECNLLRLIARQKTLAGLYIDKENLLLKTGCFITLSLNLNIIKMLNYTSSKDLEQIEFASQNLDIQNNAAGECGLY